MSHLALKVCKRKPSLEICNWKGWCCSTTWQPLLVLNVLLPWREKSWHKKCDPLKGYPKVFQVNISRSQKPSHVIQKYVMYIGVHNVYGTFWKTWSSTKSQQNLYPAYLYQVTKTLASLLTFHQLQLTSDASRLQPHSPTSPHHQLPMYFWQPRGVQCFHHWHGSRSLEPESCGESIFFTRLGRKEAGIFK